jgi:hypothetical protein
MIFDRSYTIRDFCEAERISRGGLYKLWERNEGPRWFYVGARRHISHEARVEWRQKLEARCQAGAR